MFLLVWLTAFLSGAGVLVVELAATRALAPFFGQALFVWTNVIGLVLLGLAAGSMVGGKLADRHPEPRWLAAILGLAAVLVAASAFLAPWFARWLLPEQLPLEAAYPFLLKGSFLTTLVAFVPPVFLLGAVPPFLVRCASQRLDEVGSRSGLLYGASTLGSIAGTFLTSYLLLPYLGTRGSLLLAAGLLLLAALPLLVQLREVRGGAVILLAAVALGGAAFGLEVARAPIAGTAYGTLLHAEDSSIQHIEIRARKDLGARVLALDEGHDSFQSVLPSEGWLTGKYYDYYNLLAHHLQRSRGRVDVLILGLAGGTHARQMLHYLPAVAPLRIVGIEIDPAVIEVSRDYLDLPDDPRLEVIGGLDGRMYVETCAPGSFDLILVDCFAHQSYVPFHLASVEFFAATRRALRPGGLVAVNVFGYGASDPVVEAIGKTLTREFEQGVICRLPRTANFLLYAGPAGTPLPAELDTTELADDLRPLSQDLARPFGSWRLGHDPDDRFLTDDSGLLDHLQDERLRRRALAVLHGGE